MDASIINLFLPISATAQRLAACAVISASSIRRAGKGGLVVDTGNAQPAGIRIKGKPIAVLEGMVVKLTDRERQVFGLIAEGLSNREIGERLFITERTVRFYVTSIFNKLGADNRAQAIAIANRLGLFYRLSY